MTVLNGPDKVLRGHPVGEYGGEEVSSLGIQLMNCLKKHWGEEGACSVCVFFWISESHADTAVDASACMARTLRGDTRMHSTSVVLRRHFPCQSSFGQHCSYRANFVGCDCAERQTGSARETIFL